MNSFELNKLAGGVLGAVFVALGLRTTADLIYTPHVPQSHIDISVLRANPAETPDRPAEVMDIALLLARGDVARGEKVAKKCKACHTFEKGGKNKTGPALWNIVNSPVGQVQGFSYSKALTALAEKNAVWDFKALHDFIESPKGFAKGTKMAFAGVKKADQRADLLVYLNALGDSPAALPVAEAKSSGSEAAQEPKPVAEAAQTAPEVAPAVQTAQETAQQSTGTEAPAQPVAAADAGLAGRLAGADVARGEKVARKCKACHSFEKGGKNKVGPGLWNIVGSPIAQVAGFKYSKAFQTRAQEGFVWDFANLDAYLLKPKAHIKGTKMAFAGVKKADQRADLLLYLRSLADEPAPLPKE